MATAKATRLELAYLAGIFDGEGSIVIGRVNRRDRPNPSHVLFCRVAMCTPYIPGLFMFRFQGNIRTFKPSNPNWNRQWAWSISGCKAVDFLKTIRPYLRLKKSEADLAIIFQEGIGVQYHTIPKDVLAVREAQKILMSSLKDKSQGVK